VKSILVSSLLLLAAAAPTPPRPVVLELFTSQSCSSCPPADALLASLAATDSSVLALDFHVDYWNYLHWHDRFSLPEATQRQRAYAARRGTEVYTPQLVVDGQQQAVGSERPAVLAAIATARAAIANGPSLKLARAGDTLTIDIGTGAAAGDIVLVGYDPQHATEVNAGENAGRVLREVNVVRSVASLGKWQGSELHLQAPRPSGDADAVLLQAPDGRILAAFAL
jgi:hypothetical protein